MPTLTTHQVQALCSLFERDADGSASLTEFMGRVQPEFGSPSTAIIVWCGMTIGIEPDGYTHS